MELKYSRQAIKDLRNIETDISKNIRIHMQKYAADPSSLPPKKLKKLTGDLKGYNRLRIGDYRALFTDDGIVVEIIKIRHRREAYD